MTTIEHTPSPWEDNGNGLIYGQCSGDDDEAPFVADVCNDPNRYTEQDQTNARLIVSAPALLWACRMVVARWERGDLAEAARACQAAVELATADGLPWDITETGSADLKPFSVLLLYPDYANESGTETFYVFVQATDAIEAVAEARRQAVAAQQGMEIDPDDFVPLLVTQGHQRSEPLFDK
jgi:hypothetical protein